MVTCFKCNSPTMKDVIRAALGAAGGVELQLDNLPCLKCIKCDQRFVPYPDGYDFGPELCTAITEENGIVFSSGKGFFKKMPVCCECGADLDAKGAAGADWPFIVNMKGYEPIHAILRVSTSSCPACAKIQVIEPRNFDDNVLGALNDLMGTANIEQ